jgi:ribonuclease HII
MKKIIVGIDEAGRGPLAGRVYAAAVILNPNNLISNLNDSKKINCVQREIIYNEIITHSIAYSIEYSTIEEIEKYNILNATFIAMKRALNYIKTKFDIILVDGMHYPFDKEKNGQAIIRGDTLIPEIMAASILAKVERDKYMIEMDKKYPNYMFSKHKGYPTKLHRELISKYGPSPIHRKTFKGVREYYENKKE